MFPQTIMSSWNSHLFKEYNDPPRTEVFGKGVGLAANRRLLVIEGDDQRLNVRRQQSSRSAGITDHCRTYVVENKAKRVFG